MDFKEFNYLENTIRDEKKKASNRNDDVNGGKNDDETKQTLLT